MMMLAPVKVTECMSELKRRKEKKRTVWAHEIELRLRNE